MLTLKGLNTHHPPETKTLLTLDKVYTLKQLIDFCQDSNTSLNHKIFATNLSHLNPLNESSYDHNKLNTSNNPNPHTEFLENFEKTINSNNDSSSPGLKKKIDSTYDFNEQTLNRLINQLPLKIAKQLYAGDFLYHRKDKQSYQQELNNHLQKITLCRQNIISQLNQKIAQEFYNYQNLRNELVKIPPNTDKKQRKIFRKELYQSDQNFLQQIKQKFKIKNIDSHQLNRIMNTPENIQKFIEQETQHHINLSGLFTETYLAFAFANYNYQTKKLYQPSSKISFTPATLKLDHNKIDAFLNTEIETIKDCQDINQIKNKFFTQHQIYDPRLHKYFSFRQNPDKSITIFHHLPIQITTSSNPHPYKHKDIYKQNGILIKISLDDTKNLLYNEQILAKKYILKKIFAQIEQQSQSKYLQTFTSSRYGRDIPYIRHLLPQNTKFILNSHLAKELSQLPHTIINENIAKN